MPGGLGVVEADLIAGLTAAGIPEDQAVAAVLIQRFFTSYLPPVWGWATLAWMQCGFRSKPGPSALPSLLRAVSMEF